MMGVRWDIRDIMSQHNAYVDMLVRVMQHTPYFWFQVSPVPLLQRANCYHFQYYLPHQLWLL